MNDVDKSGARSEGFFESICICWCPTISWMQFIVWISLFEIFIFIISCCIYGVRNEEFLAPDPHALDLLGWQDTRKIKQGWEIQRWFMPIFLHGHLEHLIGNLVGQIYMGVGIETGIGLWSFIFLYMITGIGGNLLSAIIRPEQYSVGASTAVFGLVGYYLAYIFTNWQQMKRNKYAGVWGQIIFLITYCSIMILMNLNVGLIGKADAKVDNWGHLGGGITGVFVSMAITEDLDGDAANKDRIPDRFTEEEYKRRSGCFKTLFCRWIGRVLFFIWIVGLTTIFYAYVDTENMAQEPLDEPEHPDPEGG